jgi:5'-3' exonuclease
MTYIIVDSANMFFRARHVVRGDADIKVGMALHIMFNSIKKAWQDFDGKHVVFCLEGRSWRKSFYKPYKANRAETRAAMTVKEEEEDKLFWETFDAFKDFVTEKSNCTVLQHPQLEADDLIGGFIQMHPSSQHVIISSDSDFYQLLSPTVRQYNGISEETHTINGILDKKGNIVKDNKTGEPKAVPNPEWLLFEKCIRGDTSDNVFSAYPGVRTKGTKNKVGLADAFEDRLSKGYSWNNLMLQRWADHEGKEHRVLDDYERNRTLIDLRAQPEEIRKLINETIDVGAVPKTVDQVGLRLMKFCNLYDMKRIIENIQHYADPFQAKFPTQDVTWRKLTQTVE